LPVLILHLSVEMLGAVASWAVAGVLEHGVWWLNRGRLLLLGQLELQATEAFSTGTASRLAVRVKVHAV